jgi:hypothetical protein
MKEKKEYKQPRITEVQLLVQSPVLANCNSVEPSISDLTTCNTPTAGCAQT